MESLALNSTILTPRGFRSRAHGPREGVVVTPRRLWGSKDIAALRDAPFVRVAGGTEPAGPGGTDGTDQDVVRDIVVSVVALALAGVPVTGRELPGAVRERLDSQLLELTDQDGPATTADPAERELASRRAWQVAGYRPPTQVPPGVLVLFPEGDHSAYLVEDLAGQLTPGLTVTTRPLAAADDADQVVREERERGAVYVTRMDAGLRYGPHHLADLVHALSHSGARVALSPRRFVPWQGTWLEDGVGAVEGAADHGLPGGSLWYAVDGAREPVVAPVDGYAASGTNAVPAHEEGATGTELAPLRMHEALPRLLDWLGTDSPGTGVNTDLTDQVGGAAGDGTPRVGTSYFARGSGGPDLARSSATASES